MLRICFLSLLADSASEIGNIYFSECWRDWQSTTIFRILIKTPNSHVLPSSKRPNFQLTVITLLLESSHAKPSKLVIVPSRWHRENAYSFPKVISQTIHAIHFYKFGLFFSILWSHVPVTIHVIIIIIWVSYGVNEVDKIHYVDQYLPTCRFIRFDHQVELQPWVNHRLMVLVRKHLSG